MKQLPIAVLHGRPYVDVSLYRLHVPIAFAGFGVDVCHVFPQGVLAAITLAEGGTGNGGARARACCEV